MADVYDEWYPLPDTDAAVTRLLELAERAEPAGDHPVLELGVGTGRLAVPMAGRGRRVVGVDASRAMVELLHGKPGGDRVDVVIGDMADDLPPGPFALAFVAVNTFFNLTTAEHQQRCLRAVADRLVPGGRFAIQAFVPDVSDRQAVTIRSMTTERLVLLASTADHDAQTITGHFVDLADGAPVRLRPFHLRYAHPVQLDAMAATAGLTLEDRWSTWDGEPFDDDSPQHVSVYRKPA
jgi:SAM-dependent methyltransferase